MTSTAPINGLFVASGVAVATAIWTAAIYLPAPAARGGPPLLPAATALAPEAPTTDTAKLQPLVDPTMMPPTAPLKAAAQLAAITAPPIDTAIYGALQMSMEQFTPAPRVSILDAAGTFPLTSMALASPLQSIGATFGDTVAGVGPELGGASPLDGPADSGLGIPVARSDEAEMASATAPPPPRGKIIVLDASEGTKIDPLRQRNWDLNAVQVIPAMPTSVPPRR